MRWVVVTADLPPTEIGSARTAALDSLGVPALVELLIAEQHDAASAVLAQTEVIARAVDEVVARIERGGVLHYVGAGTSGRLAALDAAEMPPTFGTPPNLVHAHVAGGNDALTRAVEGAEDDAAAGAAMMNACVKPEDAVLGLSASGGAAYVVAAVESARAAGAYTIALTNAAASPLARAADLAIVLDTGAEAIAGSTRLKAGTAQKVALNSLSTAIMVRIGKVYGNLMVDVVASNAKLRARALRLVRLLAQVDEARARELLECANGRVKVAVVMQRRGLDAAKAAELLAKNRGLLRRVL
jgi:N-acetylmuramic acid 6-phosphate etherase